MTRNRYLDRRINRRNNDYARMSRRDMRNAYGSQGGYVSSSRRINRNNDYRETMDYDRDYHNNPMADSIYTDRMYLPEYDANYYGYDSRYDYARNRRDYGSKDMNEEYEEDLNNWIEKLKKKNKYGMSKDQVLQQAKSVGVKFDEYSELEYYAIFLAMVSDYSDISNDPMVYLRMAKDFLEDDDMSVSPSEKVCIYMYQIVMGEED